MSSVKQIYHIDSDGHLWQPPKIRKTKPLDVNPRPASMIDGRIGKKKEFRTFSGAEDAIFTELPQ